MEAILFPVSRLSRILNWVAVFCLLAMMFLTCGDIVLRLFRRPIPGTYDLVGFLGAIVAGFALAETTIQRGHVAVQVVVEKLGQKVQKICFLCTTILSIMIFSLCSWESVRYGNDLLAAGVVSPTLKVPFFPILYGIGFSTAVVSLVLLIDAILVVTGRKNAWFHWQAEGQ
jgi:TRAP-type C4-dicarboxylate transport system permease small subunit